MSKLPHLVLGALATAMIAVGVAAQTGTVQMPSERQAAPHALTPIEGTASSPSPSPLESPQPSPVAEVASQPIAPATQ